jgi:23S rRNA (adenine2503-C2)-methyltransferase
MKINPLIFDFEQSELSDLIKSWGEPEYRARQIWEGLYKHFWSNPGEFVNLPKTLRTRLGKSVKFDAFTPTHHLESSDGQTRKTVFRLHDKLLIEAVLMKYDPITHRGQGRRTLCISSQAGCAMGCVFCATGQMGFKRNLTKGEIVAQVMHYARLLKVRGESVTNIVLMGMGEPFHNYDNSMAAIDRLNQPEGYNCGARRFTISTVGLVPMIRRFADEKRQVNLAISLHAADDEARSSIMPINKKYNISKLLEACRYYVAQTGRRITFEWALINGINDTEEVASKLAARLKGLMCHVNAIPLNPTRGFKGKATSRKSAANFKNILEQAGIPCTIRMRRGIDIQAGCGQLAGSERALVR